MTSVLELTCDNLYIDSYDFLNLVHNLKVKSKSNMKSQLLEPGGKTWKVPSGEECGLSRVLDGYRVL